MKMKKIFSNICMLALMTVAGVTFVSCEKDYKPVSGQFTMNVEASMPSDGGTKQLTLDGTGLHATWAAGEQVKVYKGSNQLGTLTPQNISNDGRSCRLSGTLTGTIAVDDELTLKFNENPNYSSQDGTLAYIAAHCDYAVATVTVSGISGGNIKTSGHANFVNQQAIVGFKLKNKAGDASLYMATLKISDGTHTYTVTPASATSEIYVAMPSFSGQTVKLTATTGSDFYKYKRTGVTLTNGQYYEIEVKMDQQGYVDLGLSVKWATCNVGAFDPEDYGDYYAWGATETWYSSLNPLVWKPDKTGGYITENAPYYSNSGWTKYNLNSTLETMDDAAYANWGSNWHIPTAEQWQELMKNCTFTSTQINGVNGVLVTRTGYSGELFLPAAGIFGTSLPNNPVTGFYFTASQGNYSDDSQFVLYYQFPATNSNKGNVYDTGRYFGLSIRPVRND